MPYYEEVTIRKPPFCVYTEAWNKALDNCFYGCAVFLYITVWDHSVKDALFNIGCFASFGLRKE